MNKTEIKKIVREQIAAAGYGSRKYKREIWIWDPAGKSANFDISNDSPDYDVQEMLSLAAGLKLAKEGDILDVAIYERFPPFGADDCELKINLQIKIEEGK